MKRIYVDGALNCLRLEFTYKRKVAGEVKGTRGWKKQNSMGKSASDFEALCGTLTSQTSH